MVRVFIWLASAVPTAVFFINFCALIFQCGCKSLWNGAAATCNIHISGARHCPWCSYGTPGYYLASGLIFGAQAAVAFWPAGWGWKTRLFLALIAFPAAGAVVAMAFGVASGYWR